MSPKEIIVMSLVDLACSKIPRDFLHAWPLMLASAFACGIMACCACQLDRCASFEVPARLEARRCF
jgi:hypothetical protein